MSYPLTETILNAVPAGTITAHMALPALVDASLSYLVATGEKPVVDLTEPDRREDRNGYFAAAPVTIANGRLQRETHSLDREGFALTEHRTSVRDFSDDDLIRDVYYAEMEQLLQRETGAARVHVFDHNVRIDGGNTTTGGTVRQPVRRVHNDYTSRSAPRRVTDLLGDEAAALTDKRFAIINVWRSIRGPVQTAPLALADARSVSHRDIIEADLVYRDRTGEIYYAAYSPRHQWVYFPLMEREEALLIKGYDSADDGRARFSLHTAFDDPTTPASAAPRESIEVRALVFFD